MFGVVAESQHCSSCSPALLIWRYVSSTRSGQLLVGVILHACGKCCTSLNDRSRKAVAERSYLASSRQDWVYSVVSVWLTHVGIPAAALLSCRWRLWWCRIWRQRWLRRPAERLGLSISAISCEQPAYGQWVVYSSSMGSHTAAAALSRLTGQSACSLSSCVRDLIVDRLNVGVAGVTRC